MNDILKDIPVLPEDAIEWFCKQNELPLEDGSVVIYWPPLNGETA